MQRAIKKYLDWFYEEEKGRMIMEAGREYVRFCKEQGATGFFILVHHGEDGSQHAQFVECTDQEMFCVINQCSELLRVRFVAVPPQFGELLKRLKLAVPLDPLQREPEDFPGKA